MIVPAVNVLWDFTSQFQYSALMPLMLWGFVKWSDVGSNSRVFLLCLFASLALGSIEIQDDPQFQQDMVAFLVSMVFFVLFQESSSLLAEELRLERQVPSELKPPTMYASDGL